MGQKILIILSVILVIGMVVYTVSSGVLEKILNVSTNLFPRNATSTVVSGRPTTTPAVKPSTPRVLPPPSPPPTKPPVAGGTPKTPAIDPRTIPQGFTLEDLSPYFKQVRVGPVSGSARTYTTISVRANFTDGNIPDGVNVTGWTLVGNRKSEQRIPRAAEVYTPSGSPPLTDIVLRQGHTLAMYSTSSPIGNFRTNKCMGYIAKSFNFEPRLSASCPTIDKTGISTLKAACQDYINSLGICPVPDLNAKGVLGDDRCRAFLSDINYGGCFAEHRDDGDFLRSEWRVWLRPPEKTKEEFFLDSRHDRVLLLDNNGFLVDLFTY